MFSRRPGHRFNRGRLATVAGSAAPPPAVSDLDPLTIVTSRTWAILFSAARGVTVATGVSQWDDNSGFARNATQGTGAQQPAYSASDAAFAGLPSITGDGADDWLSVAWDPPTVGTTPIVFFFIFRQVTWTTGDYFFGGGNVVLALVQSGASPNMLGLNSTAGPASAGATIGAATRGRMFLNNNTTDYLKLGAAAEATGTNLGNVGIAAFQLFSRNAGLGPGNFGLTWFGATVGGDWTAGEKSAMDSWAAAYCPGVLV